ncbi:hypothetical protein CLAFUW4_08660 [Fulvia fulva]|uniref:Uncharacterized protein n=1 Tax=Passalora fulva TaxID=5499 RepID=A0A9Q8LD60_PASFU|nr:uncharacterized protein CLAFUR5_08759 [Fulvia fulva]KAK4629762.1 hypothetical protein CLAFUR4_08662 [Fulvia fulva]KAK4630332.1 hypothetical protein CLAFUR0_08658 [Fulvia fulva]UJO15054.1 hypothetical protein CLAFUR5_08759 [Fulvia fulva]WPV12085.1 hypothetical protein CLAFUW4_08660 [Fulvia fulva]WPV27502.1 hypothetical protein CLAFUW7_08657 [Fulvia fulva]
MGLSDSIIILLVILAAAVSVAIGWAIYSLFHRRQGDLAMSDSGEQAEYMREVRLRERHLIAAAIGYRFDKV